MDIRQGNDSLRCRQANPGDVEFVGVDLEDTKRLLCLDVINLNAPSSPFMSEPGDERSIGADADILSADLGRLDRRRFCAGDNIPQLNRFLRGNIGTDENQRAGCGWMRNN